MATRAIESDLVAWQVDEETAPERRNGAANLRRMLVLGDLVSLAVPMLAWSGLVGLRSTLTLEVGSLGRIGVLVAFGLAMIAHKGLYRSAVSSVVTIEVTALFNVGVTLLLADIVIDHLTGHPVALLGAALAAVASTLLLVLWRSLFRSYLRAARRSGRFVRPLLIVGTDAEAARLHRLLADHLDSGYRSLGVVGDRQTAIDNRLGSVWAGGIETAVAAVRGGAATGVLIVPTALTSAEVTDLAREIRNLGGYVHLSSGVGGVDHRRFRMQPIAHEPLLCLEPDPGFRTWVVVVKRVIDVSIASLGLLCTSPLLIAAAIAVKVTDGGPILFRQRRIGRGGRPFTMLKLRTMRVGAEAEVAALAERNLREGPLFKVDDDPRITRIGRILRATDLDEVPQLFNVLRGDMSLVGPRPALPSEAEQFSEDLRHRTDVLPGITGLWQVESRHDPSFAAYERLDLFYVQNWSVTLDLVVLLLTVESKIAQRLSRGHRSRGRGEACRDEHPATGDAGIDTALHAVGPQAP